MEGISNGVGNMNLQNVDWSKKLTDLAVAAGCTGVTVNGAIVDGNVTLTMTDTASGKKVSGTYQPTLDPAELDEATDLEAAKKVVADALVELDAELKTSLQETLDDVGDAIGKGLITEDSSGYSKALFNVYDLIRLIQECGQKQKDIARDIREADLQASLAATHAEAEAQRDAARKGMWMTIGISIGMAALSMGLGSMGVSKSYKAAKMRTGGEFGRANRKYNAILKGGNGKKAAAARAKAKSELRPDEAKQMDDLFPSEKSLKSTEADVQKKALGKKENPQAEPKKEESIELQEKDANTGKFKESESIAKLKESKPKSAESNASKVEGGEKASKAEDAKLSGEEKIKDLEAKQSKLESETDDAFGELESAKLTGNKKEIKAAQDKVDSCMRKEQYGRSVLTDEKAKLHMTDSIKTDLDKANSQLEVAARANNQSLKIAKAERSAGRWSVVGNSTMMMGNAMGGIGGSYQQIEMAEATEIDAEVKESDARREESNEVFSAAQELINNILDLFRQVIASESQSTDRIIQA